MPIESIIEARDISKTITVKAQKRRRSAEWCGARSYPATLNQGMSTPGMTRARRDGWEMALGCGPPGVRLRGG